LAFAGWYLLVLYLLCPAATRSLLLLSTHPTICSYADGQGGGEGAKESKGQPPFIPIEFQ